jgi:hypothetical protein
VSHRTGPTLPESGAIFSDDRTRRLWLGRKVDGVDSPRRLFICAVQPSDADETRNDPTILRELGFARRWGFGWLDKVNVFDRHSPDPRTLYTDPEPVSPENDGYVLAAAARCDLHLCAWGNHGAHLARGARMKRLLQDHGYAICAFGFTKDGHPIHPLARGKMRIPDSAIPVPWL